MTDDEAQELFDEIFDVGPIEGDHPQYGPFYELKELEDGRDILAVPLMFGRAQVRVGERNAGAFENMW
jgi:hypothetical protein